MEHEFIWLDLETTGLDPDREIILEIGVVLADDGRDGNMMPVSEHQTLIDPGSYNPWWFIEKTETGYIGETEIDGLEAVRRMDPRVVQMHTKNGLLAALRNPKLCISIQEADEYFAALAGDGLPSIAGNSVGSFDLQFLRRHMPKFAARLSHRVFDVSTLLRAERTYGDSIETINVRADGHRAIPDALASLATARAFRARRF